jgi:hypothetical protein
MILLFKSILKKINDALREKVVVKGDEKMYEKKDILTPSYYWKGGIDVIEFAKMHFPREQVKGFLRINAMKYLVRYDEKGGVDDLEKAMNYTRMLKEMEEFKVLE